MSVVCLPSGRGMRTRSLSAFGACLIFGREALAARAVAAWLALNAALEAPFAKGPRPTLAGRVSRTRPPRPPTVCFEALLEEMPTEALRAREGEEPPAERAVLT